MMIVTADDLKHRPTISLKDGEILHDGTHCRWMMDKDLIFVGCSNITPEAARFLLAEYDRQFPKATA